MGLVTLSEVVDFLGLSDKKATIHTDNLNALIADKGDWLSHHCERWFSKTTKTDITFDRRQLTIVNEYGGSYIRLPKHYRDIVSISFLSENGVTLVSGTDFIVMDNKIIRAEGEYWEPDFFNAYIISGVFGYYNTTTDAVNGDVKDIMKTHVAVGSGLWFKNYTEEGSVVGSYQVTDVPKIIKDQVRSLRGVKLV